MKLNVDVAYGESTVLYMRNDSIQSCLGVGDSWSIDHL